MVVIMVMNNKLDSVAAALNGVRIVVIEDIWIVAQGYVAILVFPV